MPYEFTLVRSDVPNAFALPGGKIFITAGLMGIMENERELAAVLGHEVGHVAAQHNVDRMQKQMGAQVLIEVVQKIGGPDYGQAAGAATEVAATMAMLSYSRGDELWADKLGIRYMEKAGYNPYGMVELLTHLGELDESEKSTVGELFRTHPYGEDRVEQARTIIRDEHPRYSPDQPDPHREDFLHMRNRLKSKVPGV
jgi:predicted Zn-dependent protease